MSIRNQSTSFRSVASALAIALAAGTAYGQVITTLVKEGDVIAGVGTVTGVDGYAVNNSGQWIVDADTNNADTNVDRVIINTGAVVWRENDAFSVGNISSWDDHSLTNSGIYGGNLFLRNAPSSSTDSGIHFEMQPVIPEGTISTSPTFGPNTPYIGFFGAKFNNARTGVTVASIDDPNITSTTDRALVTFTAPSGGGFSGETVIAKEGDILPGTTLAIADLETDANEFDLAETGAVIYGADLAGTVADNVVVRWNGALNQVLAAEGEASPAAGRNWNSLSSSKVSISGNGNNYTLTGTLTGDTTTDAVIVRNGAIYRQEGDAVPGLPAFNFTSFGTTGAFVDDSGNVVWYGDWNDPVTTQDTGIFYNDTLIVQEGVTQIDGLTVVTVRTFADTLAFTDNGQYILFEAELTGGIEGAFLVAVPEPASGLVIAAMACGFAARRRRA